MSTPQPIVSRQSPVGRHGELTNIKRRLRKTTSRLQRHIEAIRNKQIQPGDYHYENEAAIALPGVDTPVDLHRVSRLRTMDYPVQGKLQTALPSASHKGLDYAEWEPAESLYVAILVGPDDLNSGVLREKLRTHRRQKHDAMVYRWHGEFTLDVVGFDAIDHKSDRLSGRVDMVLLSDRLLVGGAGATSVRELERVALQTRIRFRDSYIIGLLSEGSPADMMTHPFHSVERKARAKGVTVFDHHLAYDVDQERITRLLVAYAKSRRYAADRNVWLTPDLGDVPLPIPKEDAPAGC